MFMLHRGDIDFICAFIYSRLMEAGFYRVCIYFEEEGWYFL
jgi:hypothetical protein